MFFERYGPGGIAVWSGNQAILPAYITGMFLAGSAGKGLGFRPCPAPALIATPLVFVVLFFAKMGSKMAVLLTA
jgi:hypothetical protein